MNILSEKYFSNDTKYLINTDLQLFLFEIISTVLYIFINLRRIN